VTSDAARPSDGGGWRAVPFVAAATLVVLAVWGLGRRSLWLDEAITVGATHELVRTWKGTGGTMALYYALVTPWSWVSDDRSWLRALSVVFAAAAIVAVWSVARRLVPRWVAVLATVFTASSWIVVRYAQEARSYALVLALTSVAWLALVEAIRASDDRARTRWLWMFAVASVLAPLAHGLAVLQFAAQLALLGTAPDRRAWFLRLRPVLVAVVAVNTLLVALGASDVASWIPPIGRTQLGAFVTALTGPGPWAAAVGVATTGLGVWCAFKRRAGASDPTERLLALVPVAWGLVPVAALVVMSVARPYLLPRYVIGSAPGLALLWALAVAGRPDRPSRAWSVAVGLAVVAMLAWGQVDLHHDRGDGWSGAARVVADRAEPGDAIVFPNPSVRSAFDYAWDEVSGERSGRGGAVPAAISPVEPLGRVRRFYLVVDPAQLAPTLADADTSRIWVVDQQGMDADDPYAALLADPTVAGEFEVTGATDFAGGVRLVLLERT